MASTVTNNNSRDSVPKLNIDNIVSSHPELGPTPPDGGYGWIILFSAIITQITIPSIFTGYGIIIVYLNLQEENGEIPLFGLWDRKIMLVPILGTVFWLLLEPWSRTIAIVSNRPKIVSMSGILLVVAGVMLSNFSVETDQGEDGINVFSGLLIGIGASLTTQQANILLKHYFRKKLLTVQTMYRTSITLGNVLMTLIMGFLCTVYGASLGLVIYSVIIMQNCVTLFVFSRPTYVVQALKKKYKILQEASEDEDEEIYPTHVTTEQSNNNGTEINDNNRVQEISASVHTAVIEDDQDEHVIGTFNSENTTREVIQTPFSLSNAKNPFESDFSRDLDCIEQVRESPEALYRETTVSYDAVVADNSFTFDAPVQTPGTVRRTANTKKNIVILISIFRDLRFYGYTFILLTVKFSMLMFAIVYPAYLSQQTRIVDLSSITMLVMITYLGSMCLNSATAALAFIQHKRWILRIFSLLAFAAYFALAESASKSWLLIWGVLATFSTTAIYIIQEPIYNDMLMEFDASVISIASNCICALFILVITLVHNYIYSTLFKIVASLYLLIPFLCFYL